MTKKYIIAAALLFMLAGPAIAELALNTRLAMADIENDRKTIILATVDPTPEQSKKFWKTYDAFRGEMNELNTEVAKMTEEYVASYASLNDEQAKRMLNDLTKIEVKKTTIRSKYAKKLGKILTPLQLVHWLQTENKMNAVINFAALATIPMDR